MRRKIHWPTANPVPRQASTPGKRKTKVPRTATARGTIVNALRRVWLWSPERRAALKRAGYCCERCGVKFDSDDQDRRGQVHHKVRINWNRIADAIIAELLPSDPSKLEALCAPCHAVERDTQQGQPQLPNLTPAELRRAAASKLRYVLGDGR